MSKKGDLTVFDIINDSYIGEIEDANDPDHIGRCKIRVFGVFGEKDSANNRIPTEDLPWAYPLYDLSFASKSGGSGRFSSPKKGTKVRVIFDRDKYHPKYVSIEELDEKLKSELENDYDGFHSIVFDSDNGLKIYFAKKTGLLFDFDGSKINILPDNSIVIDHKNSSSTIELKGNDIDIVTNSNVNISAPNTVTVNSKKIHENGNQVDVGANPIYSAVNGEPLIQLLQIMAASIDAKLNTSPGLNANIVNAMKNLILSSNVKVSP